MNYPLLSEYIESIKLAEDNFEELKHLRPVLDEDGKPVMSSGNFAVVFKMKDEQTGKLHAVKCFLKEQVGRADAYHMIAEELESISSSCLTPIKYLGKELFVDSNATDETEFPVLLMDWVEGKTLDKYIRENIDDQYALEMLAYQFSRLAMWLLPQPFAHGDLKPDNIIVREDGSLVLVDYDGMYVPAMKGQKARELGSPDFRHPSRTADEFNEHIDDFPIASILLSLKAIALQPDLLEEYGAKDRLLLSEADYRSISQSRFFKQVFPSDNMELNKLMNLFMLALSENNLSGVSSCLFNLQKLGNGIYVKDFWFNNMSYSDVHEEDLWEDVYGVRYSQDQTVLRYYCAHRKLSVHNKEIINYTIHEGTIIIDEYAFYNCISLKRIVLPNTITTIGEYAFSGCSSLEEIIIPNSVSKIGWFAFDGCKSLRSIILPESINVIDNYTFSGCSSLNEFVIPTSVSEIKEGAFKNCNSLKELTIPYSVVHIGANPFVGCFCHINNKSIFFDLKNGLLIDKLSARIIYCDPSTSKVAIPNTISCIGFCAFSDCTLLDEVIIPDCVSYIGDWAFSDCKSLKNIELPSKIAEIGEGTFSGCEALVSINIPNSVTSISEYAFSGCTSLSSIIIPIGTRSKFEALLPDYKEKLVEQDNLDNYSTEVTEEDLANAWIDDYGVRYSSDKKRLLNACRIWIDYQVLDGTKVICDDAFSFCKSNSIILPESVTKIGRRAFSDCRELNSISIPDSVKSIGDNAFESCVSLKSVNIPSSLTIISDRLFFASGITSLTIPETVAFIGDNAFAACSELSSIFIHHGITTIGVGVFSGCSSLTSVTIPNGVIAIGEGAFAHCRALKSIDMPKTLMNIGDFAFYKCTRLKSISIPHTVASIGKSTFDHCLLLQQIKIDSASKKKFERLLPQYKHLFKEA